MFAMEAPYREDVTPHALLPSLLAAASSYDFVALVGTEPVVPLLDQESSSLLAVQAVDLLGACSSASVPASVVGASPGLFAGPRAWARISRRCAACSSAA